MGNCFIIMKFGKSEEEQSRSLAAFENYILPSAIDAGYSKSEIIREDFDAINGGSMKGQIFNNLFESEMVIADITGGNPNVYYELGIRHTFKKRGTVIIIEKGESIPFDLADDYIHHYTFDMKSLSAEKKSLTNLINTRKSNKIDSPVYDKVTALEENSMNQNSKDDPLEAENEELRKEIAKLQSQLNLQKTNNCDLNFELANKSLELYGQEIVKDLTRYMLNGDAEKFKNCLLRINVDNDYIDVGDFRAVADLCEKMRLLPHQIMILEFGNNKYPHDEDLFFDLIDAYINSPSKKHNDLAKKRVEEYYKIEYDNSNFPAFTSDSQNVINCASSNKLGTVFNLYSSRKEYRELLNIVYSAESILHPDEILIARNKAIAYRALGEDGKSFELIKGIIKNNPSDSELRLMGDSFYRIGQLEAGYKFHELRTMINYDTASAYTTLAVKIINGQITRVENGFKSTRSNKRIAKKSVVPLLMKALELAPFEDVVMDVKRILLDINAYEEIRFMADNSYSYDSYLERFKKERFDLYDWYALDFILENKSDDLDVNKYVDKILTSKFEEQIQHDDE